MLGIDEILRKSTVVPVLVVEDPARAAGLAEALVRGGLFALEVTLRTEAALEVIREMSRVSGALIGVGTVLSPDDLTRAIDAGAQFAVSPGCTEKLARQVADCGVPFLPGVATASEIMRGLDMGFRTFKYFPAAAAGGIPALKTLTATFREARFCPTGGITEATAVDWLECAQVLAVGGSWLVPPGCQDLGTIEALARNAAAMRNRTA